MEVEYELRKAVLARLRDDPDVTELSGGRVFEKLSPGAVLPASPYIVMGAWTTTSDDYECIEAYLVQISVDVYSHGVDNHGNSVMVSRLGSRVRKSLVNMPGDVIADAETIISHNTTRLLQESGGEIQRANVSLEASFA